MLVFCKNCSKEFFKLPSQIRKSSNHFCSRSCAATVNNKLFPKNKKLPSTICPICKKQMKYRHKISKCMECRMKEVALLSNRPISEVIKERTHKTNKYDLVHAHASHLYKKQKKKSSCQACGYSIHLEVCHIRAVSSFPVTATLNEVNHQSNVIFLCRNCHWEYDRKKGKWSAQLDSN